MRFLTVYPCVKHRWSWERTDHEYQLWVRYHDGKVWRIAKAPA